MKFFLYDGDVLEPFFKRWLVIPYQTRPLRLKNADTELELAQHLNKSKEV